MPLSLGLEQENTSLLKSDDISEITFLGIIMRYSFLRNKLVLSAVVLCSVLALGGCSGARDASEEVIADESASAVASESTDDIAGKDVSENKVSGNFLEDDETLEGAALVDTSAVVATMNADAAPAPDESYFEWEKVNAHQEYEKGMTDKEAYHVALSNLSTQKELPTGESLKDDATYDPTQMIYGIYDYDCDGRYELLLIRVSESDDTRTMIMEFDPDSATMRMEFDENSSLVTVYDNGVAFAGWSKNTGLGTSLWPYNIYNYDQTTDTFMYMGAVCCWDKEYKAKDQEGIEFPGEVDADGDGTIYTITYGTEYPYGYIYDNKDYQDFFGSIIVDADVLMMRDYMYSL